jgi:putative phosphonate metabolism protein
MRVAIFFVPPPEHPLTRAAALWLGRDAYSGEEFSQSAADGFTRHEIRELTASPRRYGFHATLQAPFRLSDGRSLGEVEETLNAFCRSIRPVSLGTLRVEPLRSFFALTTAGPAEPVKALTAEIVRRFDPFRAPPTAEEIEKRQPHRLSVRQRQNLERWGYPYVFHDFHFHMSLTGSVPEDRRGAMQRLLDTRFQPLLDEPFVVDALSLFIEPEPPGDFVVKRRVAMNAVRQPLDAA